MPSTLSLIRNIFTDASARTARHRASGRRASPPGRRSARSSAACCSQHFHWGAVFLVAVPILLPLLVLAPRLVPGVARPESGPARPVQRAAVADDDAAARLGHQDRRARRTVRGSSAAALAVGIGSGVLFVRRQNRSATPMLDIELFGYAPFSVVDPGELPVDRRPHRVHLLRLAAPAAGARPEPAGRRPGDPARRRAVDGRGHRAWCRLAKRFAPHALMVVGLVLVVGRLPGMILLFRHDLTVVAVIVSFIVLEIGVGISQTISNDTIVASVPARQVRCRVRGFGDGLRARRRRRHRDARHHLHRVLPRQRRSARAACRRRRPADAAESIGGATAVAQTLPAGAARSGCSTRRGRRSTPGSRRPRPSPRLLTLIAAAVVAVAFRGRQRSRRPISISAEPSSGATVRTWFHAVHGAR